MDNNHMDNSKVKSTWAWVEWASEFQAEEECNRRLNPLTAHKLRVLTANHLLVINIS
jgi:hypothetical protein